MAERWPLSKIGSHVDMQFGFAFKSEGFREAPPGIRIARGDNVKEGEFQWDGGKSRYWPELTDELRPYLLEVDDVLIGMDGSKVGRNWTRVRKTDLPCLLVQRVARLRAKKSIDPVYVAALISSELFKSHVYAVKTGSSIPHISGKQIADFEFRLPPLPEQRAIAGVLGALDDKIEVNRKTARVLEGIARAVFTSWFVDFDPVRANIRRREHAALGRAGRFISTGDDITISDPSGKVIHRAGDAAQGPIAHLFPDRLVDSAIGEVPEGWRVEGLDASIKFLNGLALQKFPPEDGRSLPVIKIAQLRKGDTDGADRASADLDPEYIVHDGDVLFSWSGSLECVLWAGGPGALNQHLFKVTSATLPKWFYYLWVHHHLPDFRHIAAGKATTMGHIQRHHLTQALVTVPTDPRLMRAMDQFFAPLIDALSVRAVQNRTLAALRDALLPKLISGELRIADAEKIVGRAL